MNPKVRFGKTGLLVTRLALGGYPFGGINRARGWDPFTSEGRTQHPGCSSSNLLDVVQ
ncbi:MAG: hypothetical protein ISS56_03565 [Anaerolineae bacterium]|nr:hypothetical protein [Anaerolineae bacterium]